MPVIANSVVHYRFSHPQCDAEISTQSDRQDYLMRFKSMFLANVTHEEMHSLRELLTHVLAQFPQRMKGCS